MLASPQLVGLEAVMAAGVGAHPGQKDAWPKVDREVILFTARSVVGAAMGQCEGCVCENKLSLGGRMEGWAWNA